MLEKIIFLRLDRLRAREDDWDLPDAERASVHAIDRDRRRRELPQVLKYYSSPPPSEENLERNALFAREEFGLDDIDTEILLLILRYERNDGLEHFADEVLRRLRTPARAVAALIRLDISDAANRIGPNGRLVKNGLLYLPEMDRGSGLAGRGGFLRLVEPLRKAMHTAHSSRTEWATALLGEPVESALEWEDFEQLGPVRDLAASLITGAGKAAAKGIHLLLHGPVGTGKTEFAKVLAARAGMSLWSVGETDEEGGEPARCERLAALKLAFTLLASRPRALLLLDEAEDILAAEMSFLGRFVGRGRNGSKVYINRLLEQSAVPVIWTCNEATAIDPAILRRMSLAIEIKTPSQRVRARVWRRVLAQQQLTIGEDSVQRLSSSYPAPPALAASAARAAALCGGDETAIEQAMSGILQLLGIGPAIAEADGCDFDPALVNCSEDLLALADCLARPGSSRQWSLCLYGSPGTGKSLFARYLGYRLGMEIVQQRASDLLSMWVGGSEKQIAAAFEAARTRHSLLVIDEADSLLSDRRGARCSWEVTQVNEMLTWMESHPYPFICTTNLMDQLDPASLRRFTLKLRFDPLRPAQAMLAFERFFGIPPPRPTRRWSDAWRFSHGAAKT